MHKSTVLLVLLFWLFWSVFQAGVVAAATIVANDPQGAAARVGAPVSVEVDLAELFGDRLKVGQLHLKESTSTAGRPGRLIPVQFEPDAPKSLRGKLWWIMPAGVGGERRFQFVFAAVKAPPVWEMHFDEDRKLVELAERELPVLRYNHGRVPVPEGTDTKYARGDYISPLFGPDGEVLTDDYPRDHPHHRGVSWSWPVTRWKDEVRDIWAVRGVWARPVSLHQAAARVTAIIKAESVWKWGDKEPIVREEVVIRAFRQRNRRRFVDVEVRLTALADEVAIGGRPTVGYGGFGLRAAAADQRKITLHSDPPGANPRRTWLDYSGVFPGGKGPAGVTIFEHLTNPNYPSELRQYPHCNYVMPAFPGPREVPLKRDQPLVLKHRLWIHPGGADEKTLADVWAAYAQPPKIEITLTE